MPMAAEVVTVKVSRESWERLQHHKIRTRARSLTAILDEMIANQIRSNGERETEEKGSR